MSELMKLPTPGKCYKKTAYPLLKCDGETMTRFIWPTCVYLKEGKCTLNGCIKNYGRVKDGHRENNI